MLFSLCVCRFESFKIRRIERKKFQASFLRSDWACAQVYTAGRKFLQILLGRDIPRSCNWAESAVWLDRYSSAAEMVSLGTHSLPTRTRGQTGCTAPETPPRVLSTLRHINDPRHCSRHENRHLRRGCRPSSPYDRSQDLSFLLHPPPSH